MKYIQAMEEIHKLRAQISNIVKAAFPAVNTGHDSNLQPPNETQVTLYHRVLVHR